MTTEKFFGHTLGYDGLHTWDMGTDPGRDFILVHPGGQCGLTPEGGFAVRLLNATGAPSIKGTIIDAHTVDLSFGICSADDPQPIGVVYENGVADGDQCWIVCHGIADILLEDSTASTVGYWARISITQDGRADITNAAPAGGGVAELDRHMREVGHCLQTVSAGTDKLCRIIMHFN